jgi:hypothetical protein
MKYLRLIFLMTLAISCTSQKSDKENVVASNPFLIGKWTGEGKFSNLDLIKDSVIVKFEIEINKDNTISGKVGDARLKETSIAIANYGFEIKGILDSRIKKNKYVKKNHLVIMLITPVKNSKDVMVSYANFHLKSNYFFDLTMRGGEVELTKLP